MIRLLLLCLTLVTFHTANAQWQWLNPKPEGNEFFDLTFVNATTGWIVGGNGAIMKTTTAGLAWSQQANPLRTTPFICLSVVFTDPLTGLISANNGSLLRTSDGGTLWELLPSSGGYIQKLKMAPDGSIWGFGGIGTIARTTDVGLTWTVFNTGITTVVFDVSFLSPDNAVASCGEGIILKSTDNGATWAKQTLAITTDIVSLDFISPTEGFATQRSKYLLHTTDAGATWKDTVFFVNNLRMIRFADTETGWMLSNGKGTVFKTENGGVSWKSVTVDPTMRYSFQNVFTLGPLQALMIGEGGGMFATTDGGNTWMQGGTAFTRSHLYGVTGLSESAAWIFGEKAAHYTTDRGATWTVNAAPAGNVLRTGYALTAARLIGGGTQGEVLLSTDAGQSWTSQILPSLGQVEQIVFPDANNGWLAGYHGTVARTTDGGTNWAFKNPGVTDDFNGVSAISPNEAWIAGNGGKIYHTTDGGTTWQQQTTNVASDLHAIHFLNSQEGWAGGQLALLKTTDGGNTWLPKTLPGLDVIYRIAFTDSLRGYFTLSRAVARTNDGGSTFYRTDYPATGLRDLHAQKDGILWLAGDFGVVQRYTPAPAILVTPASLDFGDVATNKSKDLEITIRNTGEVDMNISNIAVLGTGFSVLNLSAQKLAPGETAKAKVRFSPPDTGVKYGAATVVSNAVLGVPSVDLRGRGVPPGTPALTHTPAIVDFGKIKLGTFSAMEVTIRNQSALNLFIQDEYIEGADSLMFRVGRMSGLFFPIGFEDSVRVIFAPLRPGVFTSNLIVHSTDPAEPFYAIPLRGEAINPTVSVSDTALNFGYVYIDSSKSLNLIIMNSGTDDLITSNYRLTGPDAAEFSYPPPPTMPLTPGSSVTIPISFNPKSYGPKDAALLFESNDVIQPGMKITLKGNATTLSVERIDGIPQSVHLNQNYPNPVVGGNPTMFTFELNAPASVKLILYDGLGREIRRIASGSYHPGMYLAHLATDDLVTGVYIAELTAATADGKTYSERIKVSVFR